MRRPPRPPLLLPVVVAVVLVGAVAATGGVAATAACEPAACPADGTTTTNATTPACPDGSAPAPGTAPAPCPEPPPTTTDTGTTATTPTTPTPTETATKPPPTETQTGAGDAPSLWRRLPPATEQEAKPKAQPETPPTSTEAPPPPKTVLPKVAPQRVTPPLGEGRYVFPVLGPSSFTDTFGAARADVSWHHGDDIFAPLGAPVLAVADGTLFSVGWNDIGGNRLWLRDRSGNYFYYAHLAAFASIAIDGMDVHAGDVLGFVGNTGDARTTPYHLHFEIHPVTLLGLGYDGAVDPTSYLASWHRLDGVDPGAVTGLVPGWPRTGATAPKPGLVLIGSSDISSASGLDPRSLTRALAQGSGGSLPATVEVAAQPTPGETPLAQSPARAQALAPTRPMPALGERDFGGPLPPGMEGPVVWDQLAGCEASNRWNANTGNGFFGGLQFAPGTWLAHGGGTYAPSADRAPRAAQIAVAQRVLSTQGWRAWPVCSARLGLR